ncbi:unnamed protein product, partial [Closterium sp. Naga37s-1]
MFPLPHQLIPGLTITTHPPTAQHHSGTRSHNPHSGHHSHADTFPSLPLTIYPLVLFLPSPMPPPSPTPSAPISSLNGESLPLPLRPLDGRFPLVMLLLLPPSAAPPSLFFPRHYSSPLPPPHFRFATPSVSFLHHTRPLSPLLPSCPPLSLTPKLSPFPHPPLPAPSPASPPPHITASSPPANFLTDGVLAEQSSHSAGRAELTFCWQSRAHILLAEQSSHSAGRAELTFCWQSRAHILLAFTSEPRAALVLPSPNLPPSSHALTPSPPPTSPATSSRIVCWQSSHSAGPLGYFLTDSVLAELTFGWPSRVEDIPLRQALAARVQAALIAVGLMGVTLDTNPRALSGGNQRRLALAIQLAPRAALVLPSCCPRAALVLPSCCPRAALVLPSCCPRAALVLPSCCPRAALVLPSWFLVWVPCLGSLSGFLVWVPCSDAGAAAAGRTSCWARLEGEGGRGEAAGGTQEGTLHPCRQPRPQLVFTIHYYHICPPSLCRELAPLVDRSWRMQMGGRLREEPLPAAVSDDEGDSKRGPRAGDAEVVDTASIPAGIASGAVERISEGGEMAERDAEGGERAEKAERAAEKGAEAAGGESGAADELRARVGRRMAKKIKKVVAAGKGDAKHYYDVYGAQARAELELRPPVGKGAEQRAKPLSFTDVQDLILWVLTGEVNPQWAFIKNKPLVSRVVVLLVPGIDAHTFHSRPDLFPNLHRCFGSKSLPLKAVSPAATVSDTMKAMFARPIALK